MYKILQKEITSIRKMLYDMDVHARWVGLSISETIDFLGFSTHNSL